MHIPESQSKFAIVIPAYNEVATIRDIAERALKQTPNVIVIDDGSSDSTISQLKDLPVTLLAHENNMGKAASLWDGFTSALKLDIDVIITLDGDGQHAPEDVSLLLGSYNSNPDHIIIGARLADKSVIPAKRYYANKIANFWIAWAAGYPLSDSQSGFRLYPRRLFDNLKISTNKNDSFVFESEIIIKAAQQNIYSKPVAIPAVYAENARPSHFRGVRDITLITLMVAKSLISRAMYLPGLYRSAIKPMLLPSQKKRPDYDGYLTFLFSFLLISATAGLSYLIAWLNIFQAYRKTYQTPSQGKVLLVLGKRLENNQPDKDFKARLKRATHLFLDETTQSAYILGGKTRNAGVSEAAAGKAFLIHEGVDSKNIFLEEKSRNTLENLKHFSSISNIKNQQVYLITNRYHLARSLAMAKGFGINALACPAESRCSYDPGSILKTFIEAFHLHWYLTGKYWANFTNNKRMIDRIS